MHTAAAMAMPHIVLAKMGLQDDPEAFLELYEHSVLAWGLPKRQWVARLLSLLSCECKLMAQQLPVANMLGYPDLKRVILHWV